jgi:hypothetical protein
MKVFALLQSLMCFPGIKNLEYPTCKTCAYFIKHDDFEFASSFDLGKCMLFGEKNVVSGEIKYDYADAARKFNSSCGIVGKYYNEAKTD